MANLNLNLDLVKGKSDVVKLEELGNGVVQITMKDEENRNTFSPGIIEGLYKCFSAVAENKSYKVVILTGYENYFCSGGTKEQLISIWKRESKCNDLDIFRIALDCEIPVISAMQGHSIGGGLVLGLYADLVVLSQESIYTTNFMKYGFTPGIGCTLIVPEKLGGVGWEMMYTAQNYRGKELAERSVSFPIVPTKDVLKVAKNIAYEMAEKPRLSLITLKEHLKSKIEKKLPEFIDKELVMHEITFHQPEVANRIEQIFDKMTIVSNNYQNLSQESVKKEIPTEQELDADRLSHQNKMTNEEKILLQLQSGQLSLENAEQLLLGKTEKERQKKAIEDNQIDKIPNKLINMDSSEEILSLMSAGKISLETAEKLLLEIAEPEINTEINEFDPSQNNIPTTDIAIIGISCRYPGANNWKEFWENLKNGVDSITEPPPGRWEEKNWYHPDPEHPGTSYSKSAGFLDEIDKFDPLFFQISPEEARFIDPQQRIFLEEAYHAIEDAGYATDSLRGKKYGVFVGASTGDYSELLSLSGLDTHRMALTGNILSVIPARIAYLLDFRGPVVAIDTACSSSLVAVHQACESIQRGESEMAIAGGIAIPTTAQLQISTSQYQMVSPDGRCKAFDASASGIVWSQGCGVLVLKRYSQAIQDNDRIYGIIKGTGINYDGNTNGISAPSGKSQASLEEAVYEKFGINPETISYVEAQGTSYIGDSIEVEALTEAFSKWTNKKQFCAIGSVKTNIGHSGAASAVSGVIKTILCLKNKKLVPSLHFNQPNPEIDFENSPFYVNTELKNWEVLEGQPRQAAVNSYGISGTNAHVVIEEYPTEVRSQKSKVRSEELERSFHLLTLSAQTETALSELVVRYQNYLEEENNDSDLGDICYTANTGRTHFKHRLAVIAPDRQELVEKLRQHKKNEEVTGVCSGKLLKNTTTFPMVFLFTGQGSQYVNMGRQLYQQTSTFREVINQCAEILSSIETFKERSLLEIIYPADGDKSNSFLLDRTAYNQPALFAIEYALAKLWGSWGIKPSVVMGHSVGEYVAACIAGVFSLEDGLKLIAMRGQLMQQLPSGGEMVSVMASESQVTEVIKEYTSQVTIAAVNGPESIVVSGESGAIATICAQFKNMGIKTKQLQVSHAFHSPLMEPMLTEFEAVAKQVTYNQPKIPLISNVTGTEVGAEITTAEYWVNHVRQPVKFAQSMKTLEEQGYETFLEIGPKPILLGMGRQCLTEDIGEWLPSLCPNQIPLPSPLERGKPEDAALLKDGKSEDTALLKDEWQQMLSSLGKLYAKGSQIDWSGFDSDYSRQKVALPTYPFQRERYWVETNNNFWPQQQLSTDQSLHPLLGQKLNCASEQQIFASQIGENSPNYLKDHQIFDRSLFPATGYVEIAIAAGNNQFKTSQIVIEDLTISRGWTLPKGELTNAQTILTPTDNSSYKFQIYSQVEQQGWRLHTTGKIRKESTPPTQTKVDLEKYKSECNQKIEVKQHYEKCQQLGIDYGKTFQGIQEFWSGSNQALAYVKIPEELITQTNDYYFHPAVLDAALQVMFHAVPQTYKDKTYLPLGIQEFRVYKNPGLSLWAYASVTSQEVETSESLTAMVTIVTPSGEIIANLKGFQVKLATKQTLLKTETESREYRSFQAEIENGSLESEERSLAQQAEILKQLEAEPESRRYRLLVNYLQNEVARLLGVQDLKLLSPEEGFFDMGMDSLMTVDFKNRLQNLLGINLPATIAMEYPTIAKLSLYIQELMGWNTTEGDTLSDSQLEIDGEALPDIEDISEEDFEVLAAQQLKKIQNML